MTLEELIKDVNARGFCITNLAQRSDGRWRANLRVGETFGVAVYRYVEADDPKDALEGALHIALEEQEESWI